MSKTGTTRNVFLYDGKDGVVTDANGLYYMRARYYSPEMKRFVNEDTVLGGIMNGQTLNRFSYVYGNPVSYTDPTGQFVPLVIAGVYLAPEIVAGGIFAMTAIVGAIGYEMDKAGVPAPSLPRFRTETIIGEKTSSGNSKSQDNIAKADSGNGSGGGKAKNKMKPDSEATGDHTTIKRDPDTGKITNYETWKKPLDPRNPKPYESTNRLDRTGDSHFNKTTKQKVETPHMHDPTTPGGVRPATPEEMPY